MRSAQSMKQTMRLKLVPTPEQAAALLATLHAVNAACTYAGEVAFTSKTGNKFAWQKLVYSPLRMDYGLPAQRAIRALSKTVDADQRAKRIQPTFKPEGAIAYDERVMAFKSLTTVSLLTLQGRVLVPFRIGAYQRARRDAIQGQADLIYRKGRW
jgi:putative transposase